jgi:uncharacterized membrane protein YidH (DUF202 family)
MGYAEDGHEAGKRANANTQRLIDDHFAYRRRQNAHYLAIALVIVLLCITFSFMGA